MTETEDFLEHFGVKGMKWGVRKKRDSSASDAGGQNGGGKKNDTGPKDKWGRSLRKTKNTMASRVLANPKGMSDAELQARLKRIKMEREYEDLTKSDREKAFKAAQDFIADIMKDVAKNVATDTFTGAAKNTWDNRGSSSMTVEQIRRALPSARPKVKAIGR